jgi:type IV secretion system protein TrbL
MWTLDEGSDALREFLKKVIFIGAFIFIVKSFPWLVGQVIKGFIWVGNTAGSQPNPSIVYDPSEIMVQGFKVCQQLTIEMANSDGFSQFAHYIRNFIEYLLIIICFMIMAIQVFLVNVELGIITTLGIMLLPFGVWKPTAFIAEKVFGAIISFGVKLMVLSFILAIAYPLMRTLELPPDPKITDFITTWLGAAMLALLALHAPSVAAGLIFGSPTLTAQHVTSGVSRVTQQITRVVRGGKA